MVAVAISLLSLTTRFVSRGRTMKKRILVLSTRTLIRNVSRTALDEHPNVMVLRTMWKAFGLAGARIGYLVAQPPVVRELMKARLPFMVDRLAERTALALLRRTDLIEERVRQLQVSITELVEALKTMEGVEVVPTEANFVIFTTPMAADPLQDSLIDQGVLVRNMGGYPELEGYLRVNAGTRAENKAFLTALEKTLYSDAQNGAA